MGKELIKESSGTNISSQNRRRNYIVHRRNKFLIKLPRKSEVFYVEVSTKNIGTLVNYNTMNRDVNRRAIRVLARVLMTL